MHSLLQIIKQAAIDAVEASNPARIMYGTVEKISPLSIRIDQKFSIPENFLILTKNVKDYEVKITLKETITTKPYSTHTHDLTEENVTKKKIMIHNALEVGNKVILLREQGGQKFIVLDKVGD